ncbi:MAG: RbsD/FucU family protein [Anaerolineae bacterium]
MLKSELIHPTILATLGASGHGSGVLIADGNYPFITRANPAAERVYLNLMPGLLTVPQVLEALVTAIPVEAAHVMTPDDGSEPSIFADFRRLLPDVELEKHMRYPFYDLARGSDVSLVIATGEQRIYANILLTIGVVAPPHSEEKKKDKSGKKKK